MTAERREAASPDQTGSLAIPAKQDQWTTAYPRAPLAEPPSVPAPPPPAPAPPTAFGRYVVRRGLGAGGFGAVYLGHDTQLDRPVAIKVLRAGPGQRQAESEPALQEARRLAQLRHPRLVAGHGRGAPEGRGSRVSPHLAG